MFFSDETDILKPFPLLKRSILNKCFSVFECIKGNKISTQARSIRFLVDRLSLVYRKRTDENQVEFIPKLILNLRITWKERLFELSRVNKWIEYQLKE